MNELSKSWWATQRLNIAYYLSGRQQRGVDSHFYGERETRWVVLNPDVCWRTGLIEM
jgi:hypothetical protein